MFKKPKQDIYACVFQLYNGNYLKYSYNRGRLSWVKNIDKDCINYYSNRQQAEEMATHISKDIGKKIKIIPVNPEDYYDYKGS